MTCLEPAKPGAELPCLAGARLVAREAAFVDLLGDEAADVGVHPPGLGDEDALGVRDASTCSPNTCSSTLAPEPPGCSAFGDLAELQRVAQQDACCARRWSRRRRRQRQLTGFVDHQHVDRDAVASLALAHSHAVPPIRLNSSDTNRPLSPNGVANSSERASSARRRSSAVSQLVRGPPRLRRPCGSRVNRLSIAVMAHRDHADALAGLDEVMDDVRAAEGLSRSRRTLKRDEALVEVTDPLERPRRDRR